MNDRKKPLKPERNPSHIVFPKTGPVRRVVEAFPRVQDDLELTVGNKFLGSLKHFEKIHYSNLREGTEPADLACDASDGTTVNLQVVEVVDLQLRQLQRMRSSYREALFSSLGEDILAYNGCRVSMVDSGDPPYLPPPDSELGQVCLEQLLDHLRNMAKDINTLEVGKIRSRRITTTKPERTISTMVERRIDLAKPPRLEFLWEGGGPSYRTDIPMGLLIDAVKSKLNKHYSKPSKGKFILLAYSIDTLILKDDLDVSEIRRILEAGKHPFAEVWYIYPYAERELGALIRIWPND